MKKNKDNYENKICINCDILIMEDFCPSNNYWFCAGVDFGNNEE